jgi:16S rRNA (guanine1516-N2)-methyltransferase
MPLQRDEAIVVYKNKWSYRNRRGETFFFHPNMSILRIKQLQRGGSDSLIQVSDIKEGDRVLDCTLGLGADTVVSSFVIGKKGNVVALESELIIATLVKQGLNNYQSGNIEVDEAMRRITVVHGNYKDYLKEAEDKSLDVILFDPMFEETVETSTAIQALKPLANHHHLDRETVQEAIRVARKKIVLKARSQSEAFHYLGFQIVKKTSSYALGVLDVVDK